jgi:hypothetical protein
LFNELFENDLTKSSGVVVPAKNLASMNRKTASILRTPFWNK